MLIAQISDMHIKKPGELLYGRIDTQGYLERAVAHVNALDPSPDIALVTGDLVDSGKPEEYENLKRMLSALRMPFYLIPGNHDARDPLRKSSRSTLICPAAAFFSMSSRTCRCASSLSIPWSPAKGLAPCARSGWTGWKRG